jgi:eukaryotic-like serine/threonine-protein kinase
MLRNEGIVRLLGVSVNLPDLFIVTELVDGASLEDILHSQKRKLPPPLQLCVARQVGEVMAALHAAHIVHRDLKPSNILVRYQQPPSPASLTMTTLSKSATSALRVPRQRRRGGG